MDVKNIQSHSVLLKQQSPLVPHLARCFSTSSDKAMSYSVSRIIFDRRTKGFSVQGSVLGGSPEQEVDGLRPSLSSSHAASESASESLAKGSCMDFSC